MVDEYIGGQDQFNMGIWSKQTIRQLLNNCDSFYVNHQFEQWLYTLYSIESEIWMYLNDVERKAIQDTHIEVDSLVNKTSRLMNNEKIARQYTNNPDYEKTFKSLVNLDRTIRNLAYAHGIYDKLPKTFGESMTEGFG